MAADHAANPAPSGHSGAARPMTLNSCPICASPASRSTSCASASRRPARCRGERCGARLDAERAQPRALRHRAEPAGPARAARLPASVAKSTCAVRSASPGAANGSTLRCARTAWQRRAGARLGVAVVDEQRGAALPRQPPRHLGHDRGRAGAGFDHRAFVRRAARFGHRRIHRPIARGGHEPTVGIDRDHDLAPAFGGAHQLAHRQRVEELVGHQQQRRRRSARSRDRRGTAPAAPPRAAARADRATLRPGGPAARARSAASPAAHRAPACRGRAQARRSAPAAARPARSQTSASHSPVSSPNIWLISGAVTKSPPAPSGSREA